ncbi:MAG TPA: cytochrome c [Terriglobia bacterium]|nr:cytochrome c [Terriglobia bacterium]
MRLPSLGVAAAWAGAFLTLIATAAAGGPAREPTFAKDVAPILFANCVYCHRPGEIGPFSMRTYEETRPWAKSIKQAILTRKMPPWPADPAYGNLANSKRLSDRDIQTIVDWVDSGARQGPPDETPALPQFVEGWQIGTPDLIVRMVEPFTVPASGTIPYMTFPTDYVFPEDTWIQAVEVRPGNRAVVHHAFALLGADASVATGLHLYSPGLEPLIFREGYGKLIPKGTRIHLQLHYNANGREETDQTVVGFKLAAKPAHTAVHSAMVVNTGFAIPPMARNHEVVAAIQFPFPARIHALRPHMHLRGKDATVTLIQPDGSRKTLLYIPEWNDGWQYYYVLAKPENVPQGAIVEYVAHYDNSPANPQNPNPQATVTYGDQLWDEMHLLYINWTEVNAENRRDSEPIQISPNKLWGALVRQP